MNRAGPRLIAWWLGVLLAGGLAAASPGATAADALPTVAASAASAASAAEDPQAPARWALELDAPEAVRGLLLGYLDVSRFRTLSVDKEGITPSELARLVAITPAQARDLLQPLGYFAPKVEAKVVTPPARGASALVRVVVEPGAQAQVRQFTLDLQGGLQDEIDRGDRGARALWDETRGAWPLTEGRAFSQADWNDAKTEVLRRLRAAGFAAASFAGTAAQVDPVSQTVRIFAVADSGPRFRFGPLQIEGLTRYDERVVTRLMTFSAGDTYSDKTLLDFQERLQKAGLFESATVTMDPDPDQAAAVPIRVRLKELLLRQTTFGIGASSNSGPRVTLEHTDRRFLGEKWTSKTKAQLGGKLRTFDQDFLSYPQNNFYRNLISGSAAIDQTQSGIDEVKSGSFRLGRTQDGERIQRLYYGEWQRAQTTQGGVSNGSSAVTGNYEWIWRDLDDPILPLRGMTASAKFSAGRAYSPVGPTIGRAGGFGRVSGRMTFYQPLVGAWHMQARIEGGAVLGPEDVAVPYTLLFRTGGDDTVRGYDYQSLGPQRDGRVIGGRTLATTSLELAHPLSARLSSWWGFGFVDAGDAAQDWNSLDPKIGYGAGVQWRSPVGALKIGLAYGVDTRKVRIPISVGLTF